MQNWSRGFHLVTGIVLVGLGAAGIVLPLLPTTPLLLLAAYCFARSSPRMYRWLMGHRWLGPYLRNYRKRGGLTRPQKVTALVVLWLAIGVSVIFGVQVVWLRALVVLIAAACTAFLLSLPTVDMGERSTQG